MDRFRCLKEKANFIGMNPLGTFYCSEKDLPLLFYTCIKNKFSILEKPNKECQKLILDLDEKEKEIPKETLVDIIYTVYDIFQAETTIVICKREGSFGVHLHFLGMLVSDKIYKSLTKFLKKKFPLVDTAPFNHFIPGVGKPGKAPYKSIEEFNWEKYSTEKIFTLTKNLTGREKNWKFCEPIISLEEEKVPIKKIPNKKIPNKKLSTDRLDNIISFCEYIAKKENLDLWNDYCKWVKVGFVLAYFERKDLWHRFSSLSDKYDEDYCEEKWVDLKKKSEYGNTRIIENMLLEEGYEFDPPPVFKNKTELRKLRKSLKK